MASNNEFAAIYNDRGTFPTVADVAAYLGCTVKRVRNRVSELRAQGRAGHDVPELVDRSIPSSEPTVSSTQANVAPPKPVKEAKKIVNGIVVDNFLLNEKGNKFREEFTQQDCVNELRRVAQLAEHVGHQFSRAFFRMNSIISDGTWDRYFGTFEEFRRQGGVDLPRGAHRLELNISMHASKDTYRAMNIDKREWGERYLRNDSKRWQTIIGFNDVHDIEMDPFWRRVLIDTINRVQPEKVVLNGDGLDLPEFGKYSIDPREFNPALRLRTMHDFCGEIREAVPDAQFDWVEGNHEHRWLRWLADAGMAGTAMKVILSELHGMTVADFFGLTKFEVNYIARGDLAAQNQNDINREIRRNYGIYYDAFLACHFPDAIGLAMPGWNGHHHSHLVQTRFNPMFDTYEWHQFGSGHRRKAGYTDAEKWSNGFGIIHVDTWNKRSVTEYVNVTDFACVGGLYYERRQEEYGSLLGALAAAA